MADITMCDDKDCPMRTKCYRFTAPVNQWRQSYFMSTPRKEFEACEEYVPNEEARRAKQTAK